MAQLIDAYIAGVGYFMPEKILTNADLEKMVDTSDEWITTRTGIKERRISDENTPSSVLGTKAALNALKAAKTKPEDIDLIIAATTTPDMIFPPTACLIQNAIGAKKTAAFDLAAACSGFLYSISIAQQFIATGAYKNVLVVAAEELSKLTDWKDRNTCVLFGDGAGAAVIKPSPDANSKIIDFYLRGDGSYADLLCVPAGGSKIPTSMESVNNRLHYIRMKGNEVFKVAVKSMAESAELLLSRNNFKASDIKFVIPHQANMRIITQVAKQLDFPMSNVIVNIEKYGNISAATIPVALGEWVEKGLIKRGDLILMVAFGSGFTWGGVLARW